MHFSLDIETYGAVTWEPAQTVFSAPRMVPIDGPLHPIQTCALTHIPALPSPSLFSASILATARPGPTTVLPFAPLPPPLPPYISPRFDYRDAWARLLNILLKAETIWGMNLGFDIAVLCYFHPILGDFLLDKRPLLLDLSYINFLECPDRNERSLKTIGPVIGTHAYDKTDRDRFTETPPLCGYNAEDTHNTVLAIAELARRISISPEPGRSLKLSPLTLLYFSDTIYSTIEMTLAGVPFHAPSLLGLHHSLNASIAEAEAAAYPLIISGPGSDKSQAAFFATVVDAIDAHYFDPADPRPFPLSGLPSNARSVLQHPRVVFTEKKKALAISDANRSLFASLLPPSHPLFRFLAPLELHATKSKLRDSFTQPYLYHKSKQPTVRDSCLLPIPSEPCQCAYCLAPQTPAKPKAPKTRTPRTDTSLRSSRLSAKKQPSRNAAKIVTSPTDLPPSIEPSTTSSNTGTNPSLSTPF